MNISSLYEKKKKPREEVCFEIHKYFLVLGTTRTTSSTFNPGNTYVLKPRKMNPSKGEL